MPFNYSLPMEETSKIESEESSLAWNKGCYEFLLQRTLNCYSNSSSSKRRARIENQLEMQLPPLTDEILLDLYRHTLDIFSQKCIAKYDNSGFQLTKHEESFIDTVESILNTTPELKYLEIYPSCNHNKFLYHRRKMLIGVYVPDFIFFGLKQVGYSSVAFEINGDSHVYKHRKDLQREDHLKSLGILTLPIPNNKVNEHQFIKTILLSLYKQRSGALDNQIRCHKRKIWCKSIACNLSLYEIEEFVKSRHHIDLHLIEESQALLKLKTCPRRIKNELKLKLQQY